MEGKVSYAAVKKHTFIWEVTPTLAQQEAYRGYVALDNYMVREGPCDSDCNFDASFLTCSWKNTDDDDFNWSVGHGSLKSFTGPTKDQSTSAVAGTAGGYAFIDSSYPRRPGDA